MTDQWQVVTHIPTPRYHAGIVGVDTKIYFIGGFHSDAMFDRATGMLILFIKFEIFTANSHVSME
jgi:kelch-like protein 26